MSDLIGPELVAVLRRLKLSLILPTLPDRLALARQRTLPYQDLLLTVLADEKDEKKEQKIEAKAVEAKDAASVNFAKDLGVALAGLRTLGQRIDAARAEPDPVALALAARELDAAEQVGGKKASLTSADLVKEAVGLARDRNMPDELKAVAKLVPDGKELEEQADKTSKELDRRKQGEKPKAIVGTLTVHNHTRFYINVFVNGHNRGTVAPFSNFYVGVYDWPHNTTRLVARAPGLTLTWGPNLVSQDYNHYNWHLY